MRGASFTLASLLCVLGAAACEDDTPTQVIVRFEADPDVKADAARLAIFLWNDERELQEWDIDLGDGPDATDLPVRLPMIPRDGDATRGYEVMGELHDGAGSLLGRQRAIGGYVEGELREITLRFTKACGGLACGEQSTCRAGTCVDACVRPGTPGQGGTLVGCDFAPRDAGLPPMDARMPADDGAVPDGGAGDEDGGAKSATGCDDEHAEALFCDGFEADFTLRWDHSRQDNAVLSHVSDRVQRGSGALRAEGTEGRTFGYVATDAMDGLVEDRGEHELFVRFWVWVPSEAAIDRINLLYAGENMDPWGGVEFGLIDEGRVFAKANPSEELLQTATRAMPRDRWTCLEVRLVMDESDGIVEFWIDDELAGTASNLDTYPESGFQAFNFGIALTEFEHPPFTLWFDEVVADTARIGCD